jgi:hypothetical protein
MILNQRPFNILTISETATSANIKTAPIIVNGTNIKNAIVHDNPVNKLTAVAVTYFLNRE